MQFPSGKILSLLVLIVTPVVNSLIVVILFFETARFEHISIGAFPLLSSKLYLVSAVVLVYGFYPIVNKSVKRRGFKNVVDEYEYMKKILYIVIFVVAALVVFIYSAGSYYEELTVPIFEWIYSLGFGNIGPPLFMFIAGLPLTLLFSVTAGIIWIVMQHLRKEFNFYVAKTCFEIISVEKDETQKANYLVMGIKSYDKYLHRNLNLQINNIKEIVSMLIIDSDIEKQKAIQSLSASFEDNNDKLKPAKCLSEIANVQETKKFLIELSSWDKVKDLGVFFATIIPVAIAIIQFLLPKQ